jgi:S-adenosylmethionine-diacylglycerol 3-amino-3-carboxypropyl transferase
MSSALVRSAAHGQGQGVMRSALDRLFVLAFDDLVYNQIWEDPEVDLEAMEMRPRMTIAGICSAGCNLLAYLSADPARIVAVDLLEGHLALLELKRIGLKRLDDAQLRQFFATACHRDNPGIYDRLLANGLGPAERGFWERRPRLGRRRIDHFATGFWSQGLLGRFIGAAHLIARLHGLDPRELLACPDLPAQKRWFRERVRPVLRSPVLRFLLSRPATFFGLGIPPAQFAEMQAGADSMVQTIEDRLERLACMVPHAHNPFARQAFGRGYGAAETALPMWLDQRHLPAIRARVDRIDARRQDLAERLRTEPACSIDRFVLLDAMDWMNDRRLVDLWSQIERTARPDARVIFRTAGPDSILEGRVPASILGAWRYDRDRSAQLFARDRSAIYGGFHLYRRQAES